MLRILLLTAVIALATTAMSSTDAHAEGKWYGLAEAGASKLHRHKNNGHWYLKHWPHSEKEKTEMFTLGAGYRLRPWVHLEFGYSDLGNYRAMSMLSPACDAPEACGGQYPEIQKVTYATTALCTKPDVNTGATCPPLLRYNFDGEQHVIGFSAKFRPWTHAKWAPFFRTGVFYGWEDLDIVAHHQDGSFAFKQDLGKYERKTEGLVLGVGFDRGRFSGEVRHYNGVGGSSVNWNGATTVTFGVRF